MQDFQETGDSASSAEVQSIWGRGIDRLRHRLDTQIFAAWIKPLYPASINFTTASAADSSRAVEVILSAPNKFCCEHVERHYAELITSALSEVLGAPKTRVVFRVTDHDSPGNKRVEPRAGAYCNKPVGQETKDISRIDRSSSAPAPAKTAKRGSYRDTNLNPKYNFSNFVVGACNQFAHAVSLRVAENIGSIYNPLFIYGGVGLGKTHLANAVGNASVRRGKNVLLVSSEAFVSELIASLRSNSMPQFKERFRTIDVLIIDDIQFIIGKERTQEEFFHTFNELHQRRKQIIITSDRLPQELVSLEERLRTRFASGLCADLQAPDFETRVAILCRKAEANGVLLPDCVARIISEKIETNVRELEGALNRLLALSAMHGCAISSDLAEEALRNIVPDLKVDVSSDVIQKTVAKRFNVSVHDMLGKRRTHNIAFARQIAMYLSRRLTGCSYPEIGALFGGRDHSTVIHACRVIEERQKSDQELKRDIDSLLRNLGVAR